jgi:hypothetical protein
MAADRADAVVGHWVHSHEEDTDAEMVYRPASYSFPPSRGRTSFELRDDGSYVERSPGPVDVPVESKGSWSLEGDRLLLGADGDDPGHAWEVSAVEGDRLILKK